MQTILQTARRKIIPRLWQRRKRPNAVPKADRPRRRTASKQVPTGRLPQTAVPCPLSSKRREDRRRFPARRKAQSPPHSSVQSAGERRRTASKCFVQPEQRKQAAKPAAAKRRQVIPLVPEPPVQAEKEPVSEEPEQEMDIDEFAKYACQYAGKIDCSISGKSMLALYERIEIMEEDGIALTKAEAENLIEEAADRAENPSFFKKLTGIFSSKYDKEGLLILKEEHFL